MLLVAPSLLLAGIGGCQELIGTPPPPVDEIEITFEGYRSPDLGLTNATMTFILGFSNPTNQEIPRPEFDFELLLNDVPGADSRLAMASIPPQSSVTESIEAIVDYGDVSAGIRQALNERQLDVQIDGVLRSESATKETTLRQTISW